MSQVGLEQNEDSYKILKTQGDVNDSLLPDSDVDEHHSVGQVTQAESKVLKPKKKLRFNLQFQYCEIKSNMDSSPLGRQRSPSLHSILKIKSPTKRS